MNRLVDSTITERCLPTAVAITLTWPEMYLASHAALMRRIGNMRRCIRGKYGAPEDEGAWEPDFFSCQGEMATAKYLNLFWSGTVGLYGSVDVGGESGVETRTRRKHWHQLILHPDDKDDRPHVLVSAHNPPTFQLVGWIYGGDGKLQKFWSDPAGGRPAFFVPQEELRPIDELKAIIGGPRYIELGEL